MGNWGRHARNQDKNEGNQDIFIYFNLFKVDVLLFYNNYYILHSYIVYQHPNLSQIIHCKKFT